MPRRKILPLNHGVSIWFENGKPRFAARDISPEAAQAYVREWARKAQSLLDEKARDPEKTARADARERIAFAEEWLEAMESQDLAFKTQNAHDAIVDRFMAKDPFQLMKEGRYPDSGMTRPPISPEAARNHYEKLATSVVELKHLDFGF
jgi:hypothetical protein